MGEGEQEMAKGEGEVSRKGEEVSVLTTPWRVNVLTTGRLSGCHNTPDDPPRAGHPLECAMAAPLRWQQEEAEALQCVFFCQLFGQKAVQDLLGPRHLVLGG